MELSDLTTTIETIVSQVVAQRNGNNDPTDEFLTELIVSCYKQGLHRADAEFGLQDRFGDDQAFTELFTDVWSDCAAEDPSKHESDATSVLEGTPFFPDSVYKILPRLLKEGTDVFDDPRQRDVFLLTALAALSSILTNVSGLYAGDKVSSLLYAFVVAPAASGKSVMKYAGKLVDKIHRDKKDESEKKRKMYEVEKREYDKKARSTKGNIGDSPVEPPFEVHFIPGNSSSASVIAHLEANQGKGLIFETESDSLSSTFASEWGNFSDMLRKNFHHEPIRSARKTNGEYKEIEHSSFSACLTGTPGQVTKLIQSSEDGLFSRMSFYLFSSPLRWIDPSPSNHTVNYTEHFELIGQRVSEMHQFFSNKPCNFSMNEAQWDTQLEFFSEELHSTSLNHGVDSSSVVKRAGITCFRIAMVLASIDHFLQGKKSSTIVCPNHLFLAAFEISKVLLQHNLLVFQNLPKQGESQFTISDYREEFRNSLPHEFSRSEAVQLGKKLGHSEKTADNMLRAWFKEGKLVKPRHGYYGKPTVNE